MKAGASAPPAVNVGNLIGQQGNANITSAEAQSGLNNAGTAGPLGASWWTPTSIDPGTGRPSTWEQTQQLGTLPQAAFNNQATIAQQLAGAAGGTGLNVQNAGNIGNQLIGNAFNTLPQSGTQFQNEVTQAQNAAYNTQAGYLNPQFAEKQSDLNQQLADQGITAGSAAYDRAQGDLGRESDLAYQQAQNAAVQAGNQEQNTLFGQQLATGQFGQSLLGGASSELPNLGTLGNFTWAGGIPSQGGTPSGVTPPNIAALQNAANQGNQNNFSGGQALLGQLGSIGNAALPALFGSQGISGFLGANPQTGIIGSLGALLGGGGVANDAGLAASVLAAPFTGV